MLNAKDDALDIDSLNRVPLLLAYFMRWLARACYAGIVDETIQPAAAPCRLAVTVFDHGLSRNVANAECCHKPPFVEFSHKSFVIPFKYIGNCHSRTFLGSGQRLIVPTLAPPVMIATLDLRPSICALPARWLG